MKFVANESCTVAHAPGSTTSGGTFTITTPPSLKTKAVGSGVYRGTIAISFSGGNSSETFDSTGAITPGTVAGSGTISPTASKVRDAGNNVIREADTGTLSTLTGTFVPSAPPNTSVPNTPLPPTDVEVSSAGQDKVRGN